MISENINNKTKQTFVLAMLALVLLIQVPGCQPPPDPFIDLADAKNSTLQIDDQQRAMDLVLSTQSYEFREFEQKVTQGLNRWLGALSEQAKAGETPFSIDNAKLTQWLNDFNDLPAIARYNELSFVGSDAHYLREKYWLNSIAKRTIDSATPQNLELYRLILIANSTPEEGAKVESLSLNDLVQKVHPDLSAESVELLTKSLLLFDWVIRSIQLELPPESGTEENPAEPLIADQSEPARAGIRGLGYTKQVWQTLLYGKGDYVDRAKIFLGLCEQIDLPAAMVSSGENPWAVGVLIGQDFYLFDTNLGLGVPVPGQGRVATLRELREHPEWLEQLNLTVAETSRDDSKYWLTAADLDQLSALIYTSPESSSRRMKFLEERLVGDQKLRIAFNPTTINEQIASTTKLPTQLWDIEFKTHAFREAMQNSLAQAGTDTDMAAKLSWYYSNYQYIDLFGPYRNARNLFLLGKFKSEKNSRIPNAVESFYNLMYTDKTIEELSFNKPLLTRLGILQSADQAAAVFNERVRSVQQQMYLVREDMGLFLSQVHFDNGNIGTAGNWLRRIIDQKGSDRWKAGVQYLWARTHEIAGDLDAALTLYKSSDSPQFHGELLRARIIQRVLDAESTKPDSSAAN